MSSPARTRAAVWICVRRTRRTPTISEDREHGDHHVPRALRQRRRREGRGEVVRQEERRQRDHDQVVEEEHPARREADEVVEGAARERRGAAGLRDRRRALGVRQRDDQEEDARREQHERRQAESLRRHDPEREVDRRADLVVGDREQRRRVENPLEARGPYVPRLRSSWMRPTPSATNSAAEDEADEPAAVDRRDDEQGKADEDEHAGEHVDRAPVPDHAAASSRDAVTITRHGACRST